jgi:hypothetical protein
MDHPMNGHYEQYPQGMGATHTAQTYGPAAAQGHYPYAAGYAMPPTFYAQQNTSVFNDRFLKGLLIGAAAAYLLTNETVQRTAIKGVVKAWSLVQGGVEELTERFHDAEAEIRAEKGE